MIKTKLPEESTGVNLVEERSTVVFKINSDWLLFSLTQVTLISSSMGLSSGLTGQKSKKV